jgi:sulfite reductase alpha subunit
MKKPKTPNLDELEKGRWPSHVTELKKTGNNPLIEIYELNYEDKETHWVHGGMVTVPKIGAGVIGRISDKPEIIEDSHTFRIIPPSAYFYKTEYLRKLVDIWEKYGSGLMLLHGATGDINLIGIRTKNMNDCYKELLDLGFDFGGAGPGLRTPAACVGPARCEMACINTLDLNYRIIKHFINDIRYPRFPYKSKIKFCGCSNDCHGAMTRADIAVIGTWKDSIKINQKAVKDYAKTGLDINYICSKCPTKAVIWDEKELKINDKDCTRCMHCINKMPKALSPGDDRGATILIGGKCRGRYGAFLSWVVVPFMKLEPPYTNLKELISKLFEWWDERGNPRERIGELIYRYGYGKFLKDIGLPAVPQQVYRPRANPFYFKIE